MKKRLLIIGLLLTVGCSSLNNNLSIPEQSSNTGALKQTHQLTTDTETDINNSTSSSTSEEVTEPISNPFFFEKGVLEIRYNARFLFDDQVKKSVKLYINDIDQLKYGKLYELKLEPTESVPNERLSLGYFYVQNDKIYQIEATQENLNQLLEWIWGREGFN